MIQSRHIVVRFSKSAISFGWLRGWAEGNAGNLSYRLSPEDLSGAELYTSCEPCPMCSSVIIMAGIAKLYYAASAEDTAIFGNDPSRLRREVGLAAHVQPRTVGVARAEIST